ncbi:lysylphosphatidylglycerol synthase transmembrane domain-containing protein, partial [Acidobacteriota bacterium]
MNSQTTKKWLIKSLGLILFLFILWRIDEKHMLSILAQAEHKYIVIGLLLTIPLTLIKSIRWRKILKALGHEFPLDLSCLAYFAGQFWGLVSPARVGEFIKVRYLQAHKVSVIDGTFSVLLDRILDVISLFFIGALSLLFWEEKFEILPYLTIIILSALLLSVALVAFSLRNTFLDRLIKIVPEKLRIKILEFLQGFRQNIANICPRDYSHFFLYTLFGWVIYFLLAYFLALALSIDLPFLT